jgi:hypothetical protein
MVHHGTAWHGMVQYGISWYGMAHNGKLWHCMAQHGTAWHIMVKHGTAWHIMAHHGTTAARTFNYLFLSVVTDVSKAAAACVGEERRPLTPSASASTH